jgi:hypothetical protein
MMTRERREKGAERGGTEREKERESEKERGEGGRERERARFITLC